MRTKAIRKSKNLQVPGELLQEKELVKLIKDAEKGPFMTIQEGMKDFELWLKLREKK
jgi:hypothetical protein